MLILLPPSEGKTAPSRGASLALSGVSFSELTATRDQVIDALVALSEQPDAAQVLGLGATQADLVHLNAGVRTLPTARADAVYSGVVYDAIDFATLTTSAKRRAQARVAVTSSLFGLLRPADRIPAYRLSGDVTLPGLGPVANVWRDTLGAAATTAMGKGLLVDLRSGMYANFWKPGPELAAKVATVRVLHEVNGKRKVVSHFNKATKGRIVRALLEDGRDPKTPKAFAAVLRDLGWTVEVGELTPKGTQLDVIVAEI